MKENFTEMCKRHEREIEILQKNCKHKKLSKWANEYWAFAHPTGGRIKLCEFCGKIVKREEPK